MSGPAPLESDDPVQHGRVRARVTATSHLAAVARPAEDSSHGELSRAREQLRSVAAEQRATLAELRSTKKILRSLIEQFQRVNAALECSREEIHAMNAELHAACARRAARQEDTGSRSADLKNLFDSLQIGTIVLDAQLVLRSFTAAAAGIYNLLPGDVGRPLTDITSHLSYTALQDDVQQVLATLEPLEQRVVRNDATVHYLLRILPYRIPNEAEHGVLLSLVDVTTIVQAEQHQRRAEAHLSAYDPLTGLPNRRTLETHMDEWRRDGRQRPAALLFLDLDRFKTINDSFGHVAGDAILVQVASRLRLMTPADGIASRLGGDEFILFWPGAEQGEAEALAERLVHELAQPLLLGGQPHHATASIGVACSTNSGASDLMCAADTAMYAAKRQGGSRTVSYGPIVRTAVMSHMPIEQDRFGAIGNDEMEIRFQPLGHRDRMHGLRIRGTA